MAIARARVLGCMAFDLAIWAARHSWRRATRLEALDEPPSALETFGRGAFTNRRWRSTSDISW
jgi:hypothetical protein